MDDLFRVTAGRGGRVHFQRGRSRLCGVAPKGAVFVPVPSSVTVTCGGCLHVLNH